jgi:hypothetical protein
MEGDKRRHFRLKAKRDRIVARQASEGSRFFPLNAILTVEDHPFSTIDSSLLRTSLISNQTCTGWRGNRLFRGTTSPRNIPRGSSARISAKRQFRPCGTLNRAALNELVAQSVEQRPFKAWVLGSNPSELTISSRINDLVICVGVKASNRASARQPWPLKLK